MCKEKKNAYMTVEASLLYPLIFGGILFTICLSLYLYNVAVLQQITYIAALRGSLQSEMNEKETKTYVSNQIKDLLKEKTIFITKIQESIVVSQTKVKVEIKAKVNLPFVEFPFLNLKWKELNTKSEAGIIHPVMRIRNTRRMYGS